MNRRTFLSVLLGASASGALAYRSTLAAHAMPLARDVGALIAEPDSAAATRARRMASQSSACSIGAAGESAVPIAIGAAGSGAVAGSSSGVGEVLSRPAGCETQNDRRMKSRPDAPDASGGGLGLDDRRGSPFRRALCFSGF
jgi:hypothetical protein